MGEIDRDTERGKETDTHIWKVRQREEGERQSESVKEREREKERKRKRKNGRERGEKNPEKLPLLPINLCTLHTLA